MNNSKQIRVHENRTRVNDDKSKIFVLSKLGTDLTVVDWNDLFRQCEEDEDFTFKLVTETNKSRKASKIGTFEANFTDKTVMYEVKIELIQPMAGLGTVLVQLEIVG